MISGIGIDIESVNRFKKQEKNRNFLNLVFTKREIDYCRKKKPSYASFAGKFCAKEAVLKACHKNTPLKRIEIRNINSGIAVYMNSKKNTKIHCSISHTKDIAIAFAVIER